MEWKPIDTAPRCVVLLLYSERWMAPLVAWIDKEGYVYMPVSGGKMSPRDADPITYWTELTDPFGRTHTVGADAPVYPKEDSITVPEIDPRKI